MHVNIVAMVKLINVRVKFALLNSSNQTETMKNLELLD